MFFQISLQYLIDISYNDVFYIMEATANPMNSEDNHINVNVINKCYYSLTFLFCHEKCPISYFPPLQHIYYLMT